MKVIKPCSKCYGKGYSTELKGDEFCMADFIGDKTYRIRLAGIRIRLCNCSRGEDLKKFFNIKNKYKLLK